MSNSTRYFREIENYRSKVLKSKGTICKGCRKKTLTPWSLKRDKHGVWCSESCYNIVTNFNNYANERYAPHDMRIFILERDGFKCLYCKISVSNETANMEHVAPWPSGKTVPSNLVTACRNCNKEKYIKEGYELIIDSGSYRIRKPDYMLPDWATDVSLYANTKTRRRNQNKTAL